MPAYVAKKKGMSGGLPLGWPYLDEMTGGLLKGDMISYVGRPSHGKTWMMLYGAHHGWLKAELDKDSPGSTRMFVSMEMNVLAIEQRLVAMHTHLPAFKIKHGVLGTAGYEKFKKSLKALQGYKAPFWVVDGNLTATVEDVVMLARQLKPDGIWIDGALPAAAPEGQGPLCPRRREPRPDQEGTRRDRPDRLLVAVQARRRRRRRGSKDADLEDIGYSDAIGQHSSLVLGLFEDETVETLKQRVVKVLKGRNGETGEFKTKFRFDTMDFGQVEEKSLEELQFYLRNAANFID